MIFRAYYPKPLFPPISLSKGCMLMCRHCMGKYLRGMTRIESPEKLSVFCKELEEMGGKGILVSGGSDRKGRIMGLEWAVDALRAIKRETNLVIAVHTGYIDRDMSHRLVDACDIAFIDVVGSDETVRKVIGLDGMNGYVESLDNLISAGITVTPHITVGLHYGNIRGEHSALAVLETVPIKKVVLNIILPTKGTDFENIGIPSIEDIKAIMRKTRMQGLETSLGCMRPRGMPEIEMAAIEEGIIDIALPSKNAVEYARDRGYAIKKIPACCGLTNELIEKIEN